MELFAWLIFLAAAVLEVGGDAMVRKGLHGRGALFIIPGCLMLGCYGIIVNTVRWDFSKLLGGVMWQSLPW
jgi:drug/metabolite transporter superfamily protein YnfA